jgi:hypothetical protein
MYNPRKQKMIEKVTYDGATVRVHLASISLKATKAFTHGSFIFDKETQRLTMGQLAPVPIPAELELSEGAQLNFQLVAPDGALRKQTRCGVLKANEKQPSILRIAGMAKTARRYPAEEGWRNEIYKYRACFAHEGLKTDAVLGEPLNLPEWLKGCVARQKALWNRLAWLCRDARRKCSPAPTEAIAELVKGTILPMIDAFNFNLGRARAKEKMRHPAKLKVEMPGLDGVWSFIGELRHRIEKGQAVPEKLLEEVVAFAEQYKAEYTPINEFLNNFAAIAEREARALGLRHFEVRPTVSAFKAVLDRRKTTNAPWSEGWPLIKYPDRPKAADWGVYFYFNKAGVDASLLETGPGVPGLRFSPPVPPEKTGHKGMTGAAAKRALREAEISITGDDGEKGERWSLRFGVLQHRPLPPNSHIKEWKLLFQNDALWLCLVVELQRPPATRTPQTAGLDIGWRRTEDGIRFGTLYESATKTVRELTLDLTRSPGDHKNRVPFRIDLGPDSWTRTVFAQLERGETENPRRGPWDSTVLWRAYKDWKPKDGIPGILEIRTTLQARNDYLKETAKILLRKHLGDKTPAWLEKAGRRGLFKMQTEFLEDARVQEILTPWREEDGRIARFLAVFAANAARRIEYGQAQVAHDICRYLVQKNVKVLVVEKNFLSKLAQHHDNEDPVSLKRSQKYRQFAAAGRFVTIVKNTTVKYGIVVDEIDAANTTRMCHYCDFLNPSTEKECYNCGGCGRQVKQDENSGINLVRFAADPELAKKAQEGGREA